MNIVDATNLERNLYLTSQLQELGIPVLVVLNMMDAVEAKGDRLDAGKLEKLLGSPVVAISASRGKGLDELIRRGIELALLKEKPLSMRFGEPLETAVAAAVKEVEPHLGDRNGAVRWAAIKLLEQERDSLDALGVPPVSSAQIRPLTLHLGAEEPADVETMFADARYAVIQNIVDQVHEKNRNVTGIGLTEKIDRVVTHKLFGIPLFLVLMFGVFQVTFGTVGSATIDGMDQLINGMLGGWLSGVLEAGGAAPWLHALVVDGIVAGLGGILVFVPQIMLLFLFLSLLEDSGYMSRAAFVMDRLLRKLGLSGKSFIPMLMGFGCSTPAIMATRTLENEKDRRLTIILTPFMSCGARMPIYALFAAAFFARNQSVVIFSVYVLGIVVAILSGLLLKKTVLKGEAAPFLMELPPYRVPTLKGTGIHMWERGKGFMKKAGTVIFAASVLIWFCQSFDFSLRMVEDPAFSIFGLIGTFIAPVFAPLGFGDWKSSMAILTGFAAKEVVVATLGILHGVSEATETSGELITAIQTVFTPLRAYAFMAFTLLYMPCLSAFAAIRREMNSWKWTLFAVGYQTAVAWLVAFAIYQVGSLIGLA